MSLKKLNAVLSKEVEKLQQEGRAKIPERVIVDYVAPNGSSGPRYILKGSGKQFIRMNSNSYLSMSHHPELIEAADSATRKFGVGPGAVRFIDGTFEHHVKLEEMSAKFVGKEVAKIFNSAYTANLGLALAISNEKTYWVGDQLNHNSIIRAMRISGVQSHNKGIYAHNDMKDLKRCMDAAPEGTERVVIIFDGIFSMRGDFAPINEIVKIAESYDGKFKDGVITIVDDSHGIGAYGKTGRGTAEFTSAEPDIIVGTFGKAFGVNGGFIAGSRELVEAVRQKSDTYIYTNPLSVADCAAASKSIDIVDGPEGMKRLKHLHELTQRFRNGIGALGMESIPGPHPIVPLLVRDTGRTKQLVKYLFDNGILAVGLTYPVVPQGNETIRFQVNAAHTNADIDYVLKVLGEFR